jgi:hypothetical protein
VRVNGSSVSSLPSRKLRIRVARDAGEPAALERRQVLAERRLAVAADPLAQLRVQREAAEHRLERPLAHARLASRAP